MLQDLGCMFLVIAMLMVKPTMNEDEDRDDDNEDDVDGDDDADHADDDGGHCRDGDCLSHVGGDGDGDAYAQDKHDDH